MRVLENIRSRTNSLKNKFKEKETEEIKELKKRFNDGIEVIKRRSENSSQTNGIYPMPTYLLVHPR